MATKQSTDAANETTGAASSLKRLQRDGGHSLDELREFLGQLRGRSPQEVLGIVTASHLIRAVLQATLGCIIVMAIFTIIPYFIGGKEAASKPQASPATASPDETTTTNDAATNTTNDSVTPSNDPDPTKAAKALDIDEAKPADPNINPLDKDLDKLLDGK